MMSDYIAIGTILNNRYEITELLGHGGMAYVYKAHCRVLNRNVAIKVLRDEFVRDETFIRRFTTEAQAAAALSHANIVSIFDVISEGDLHYIVMELIEGITLKEYIDVNKPLDWQTAANFEQQICAALDCAHKNNIIHQDIKPQNILITPEGVLKVTDFGIAHAANSSTIIAGDPDGAVGSVHYCSPEQARGGYTDAKTDIYSAGVVLYEMLTGQVPFDATTPVAVAMKHIEETVPSPRALNPNIPEDLEKIIFKSMNREKRMRYASAADMFRDLSYVFEGISVSATVEGNGEEEHTTHRRKRAETKSAGEPKKVADTFIVLASIITAIIIICLVIFIPLSFGGQRNEVFVPDIVNKTQEEATLLLAEHKLELRVEEIVPSSDVPAGAIIEQEPASGRSVQKGSVVTVRISAGVDLRVPNVVGYDLEQAVKELEKMGFKVLIRNRQEDGAQPDEVVDQKPAANTAATRGDSITIYVNMEGEEVVVPRLIGKTKAEAERILTEAGLKLGEVTEKNSVKPRGEIIAQTPEGGTSVQKDSTIDIVISNGQQEDSASGNDGSVEQLKEKSLSIPVPTDKETTQIRVEQDGLAVHDAKHAKSEGSFNLKLRGTGTVKIEIFHDGVSKGVRSITF